MMKTPSKKSARVVFFILTFLTCNAFSNDNLKSDRSEFEIVEMKILNSDLSIREDGDAKLFRIKYKNEIFATIAIKDDSGKFSMLDFYSSNKTPSFRIVLLNEIKELNNLNLIVLLRKNDKNDYVVVEGVVYGQESKGEIRFIDDQIFNHLRDLYE